MPNIEWIKITTTMFDDDKIKLIESMPERDTLLVIWVKLLAQAGKCNASGHLILSERIAFNDEMLATIFNRPINSVRLALDTFEKMGMIERDETIYISNWEKHQNVDGMERVRELNKIRNQKYRENKKLLDATSCVTLHVTSRDGIRSKKEEKEEKEENLVATKPATSSDDPQKQQHRWFVAWFCWAYLQTTGEKYAFRGSDARQVKELLHNNGLSVLLERATHWLFDSDRFPRGSPEIKGLYAGWNRMAGCDGIEAAVKQRLLPPPGESLNTFNPWKEQQA